MKWKPFLFLIAGLLGGILLLATIAWLARHPRRARLTVSVVDPTNDANGNREMVFLIRNNEPVGWYFDEPKFIQAQIAGEWKVEAMVAGQWVITNRLSSVPGIYWVKERSGVYFRLPIPTGAERWIFGLECMQPFTPLELQRKRIRTFLGVTKPIVHKTVRIKTIRVDVTNETSAVYALSKDHTNSQKTPVSDVHP